MTANVKCFFVDKKGDQVESGIKQQALSDLPDGQVLIQVSYSAVNYKDGLASQAHPGVAVSLPLVPGIDAVGTVIESTSDRCSAGDQVMVSGADFGTKSWGGWATHARMPGSYCFKIPQGMTSRQAAIIGTAGFTAAYSVEKLQHHGIGPDAGSVLVSGATGGVGTFAVRLLSQLGYHVVAVTGKPDRHEWLRKIGAAEVVGREAVTDTSNRPLLSGRWAAAVDTVGGAPLETILRSTKPGGCVTACGLVAGHQLPMTVYPFILRGVSLQGIDSANASVEFREHLWHRLATDFKMEGLQEITTEVELDDVAASAKAILNGQIAGRHLVKVAGD